MTNLFWIQEWYKRQCNGDWEHDYGIRIETLDNPGWSISIDTTDSENFLSDLEWVLFELSEDNWYGYKVSNGTFEGSGDPTKLDKLIELFKELISK